MGRGLRVLLVLVLAVGLFGAAFALSERVRLIVANAGAWAFGGTVQRGAVFDPETGLKADVYYPPESPPGRPRDVVIYLFGGGWQRGSRETYPFLGVSLAEDGFVTVIPDYRTYPEARFPEFVHDAARAVAWVHREVADGGRIFVMGHSAGGHIGALLAADERYLREAGAPEGAITGFVGLAGPYHFTPEDPVIRAIFDPPERYPDMQASTFVDGSEPPMALVHGEQDTVVGRRNLDQFATALRDKGVCHRVLVYPDEDHTSIVAGFAWLLRPGDPVADDVVAFLRDPDPC